MNLSTIPTPPINQLPLFGVTIHIYALCILSGMLIATIISYLRLKLVSSKVVTSVILDLAIVALPAGIIGARLYYVITVPQHFLEVPLDVFAINKGGLGIMGGVVSAIVATYVYCQKRGVDFAVVTYCIVPTIPIGQAVGRLGNWFNAELYGTPTNLPWALDISRGQYVATTFYHPTFLYEMLWNILIFTILILLFKPSRLKYFQRFPAIVVPVYLLLYASGRLMVESLRTDYSEYWLNWRINSWIALVLAVFSLIWIGVSFKRHSNSQSSSNP